MSVFSEVFFVLFAVSSRFLQGIAHGLMAEVV